MLMLMLMLVAPLPLGALRKPYDYLEIFDRPFNLFERRRFTGHGSAAMHPANSLIFDIAQADA